MKHYEINIKSHCEAPDLELEFDAENMDEAVEKVQNTLIDWSKEDLIKYINETE